MKRGWYAHKTETIGRPYPRRRSVILCFRSQAARDRYVYQRHERGVLVTRETLETEHPMVFFCLLAVWLMVVAAARWRW